MHNIRVSSSIQTQERYWKNETVGIHFKTCRSSKRCSLRWWWMMDGWGCRWVRLVGWAAASQSTTRLICGQTSRRPSWRTWSRWPPQRQRLRAPCGGPSQLRSSDIPRALRNNWPTWRLSASDPIVRSEHTSSSLQRAQRKDVKRKVTKNIS